MGGRLSRRPGRWSPALPAMELLCGLEQAGCPLWAPVSLYQLGFLGISDKTDSDGIRRTECRGRQRAGPNKKREKGRSTARGRARSPPAPVGSRCHSRRPVHTDTPSPAEGLRTVATDHPKPSLHPCVPSPQPLSRTGVTRHGPSAEGWERGCLSPLLSTVRKSTGPRLGRVRATGS